MKLQAIATSHSKIEVTEAKSRELHKRFNHTNQKHHGTHSEELTIDKGEGCARLGGGIDDDWRSGSM